MTPQTDSFDNKHFKATFEVCPGFELFLALQNTLDSSANLHKKWRREAVASLPDGFLKRTEALCGNPLVWPNLADALGALMVTKTVPELLLELEKLDANTFALNVLEGALHTRTGVEDLASGERDLEEVVASAPIGKRDWLAILGLFPYDKGASYSIFLNNVLADPESVKSQSIEILRDFNRFVFEPSWNRLEGDLKRSADRMERLFATCSFDEFARQGLLRIEIDDSEGLIRAVRGGCTVSFEEIEEIWFVPSTFNEKRLWNAFKNPQNGKTSIVFPVFDPDLRLSSDVAAEKTNFQNLDLDAALIFRAMGDPTRFAIASIIAKSPTTAAELAAKLSLSKPTVSHHVQKLRLSGLIYEEWSGGSVILSLRREVIKNLSEISIRAFYGTESY